MARQVLNEVEITGNDTALGTVVCEVLAANRL
jgi:hypothetical protein